MKEKPESYYRLLNQSYSLLRGNLVLLVPSAVMLFLSIIILLLFLSFSGLLASFLDSPTKLISPAALLFEISSRMPGITLYVIGYILIEVLLEIFFVGMKYGMIKDVVKTGRTSLESGLRYGISHFLKVVEVSVVYYAIMFIPVVFLIFAGFWLLMRMQIAGAVIVGLLLVVSLVYLFHISFRMLFIFPIMAIERTNVLGIFRKDFHYVKTHAGHTFISWIIVIVIGIFISIVKAPGQAVSNINLIMGMAIVCLMIAIEFIVTTWEHIFVFKAYLEGKGEHQSQR